MGILLSYAQLALCQVPHCLFSLCSSLAILSPACIIAGTLQNFMTVLADCHEASVDIHLTCQDSSGWQPCPQAHQPFVIPFQCTLYSPLGCDPDVEKCWGRSRLIVVSRQNTASYPPFPEPVQSTFLLPLRLFNHTDHFTYLLGYRSILRDSNETLANVNGVNCSHFARKFSHSTAEGNQVQAHADSSESS